MKQASYNISCRSTSPPQAIRSDNFFTLLHQGESPTLRRERQLRSSSPLNVQDYEAFLISQLSGLAAGKDGCQRPSGTTQQWRSVTTRSPSPYARANPFPTCDHQPSHTDHASRGTQPRVQVPLRHTVPTTPFRPANHAQVSQGTPPNKSQMTRPPSRSPPPSSGRLANPQNSNMWTAVLDQAKLLARTNSDIANNKLAKSCPGLFQIPSDTARVSPLRGAGSRSLQQPKWRMGADNAQGRNSLQKNSKHVQKQCPLVGKGPETQAAGNRRAAGKQASLQLPGSLPSDIRVRPPGHHSAPAGKIPNKLTMSRKDGGRPGRKPPLRGPADGPSSEEDLSAGYGSDISIPHQSGQHQGLTLDLIKGYASGYVDGRCQLMNDTAADEGQRARSKVVKEAVLQVLERALLDALTQSQPLHDAPSDLELTTATGRQTDALSLLVHKVWHNVEGKAMAPSLRTATASISEKTGEAEGGCFSVPAYDVETEAYLVPVAHMATQTSPEPEEDEYYESGKGRPHHCLPGLDQDPARTAQGLQNSRPDDLMNMRPPAGNTEEVGSGGADPCLHRQSAPCPGRPATATRATTTEVMQALPPNHSPEWHLLPGAGNTPGGPLPGEGSVLEVVRTDHPPEGDRGGQSLVVLTSDQSPSTKNPANGSGSKDSSTGGTQGVSFMSTLGPSCNPCSPSTGVPKSRTTGTSISSLAAWMAPQQQQRLCSEAGVCSGREQGAPGVQPNPSPTVKQQVGANIPCKPQPHVSILPGQAELQATHPRGDIRLPVPSPDPPIATSTAPSEAARDGWTPKTSPGAGPITAELDDNTITETNTSYCTSSSAIINPTVMPQGLSTTTATVLPPPAPQGSPMTASPATGTSTQSPPSPSLPPAVLQGLKLMEPLIAELKTLKGSMALGKLDPAKAEKLDVMMQQMAAFQDSLKKKFGPNHPVVQQLTALSVEINQWRSTKVCQPPTPLPSALSPSTSQSDMQGVQLQGSLAPPPMLHAQPTSSSPSAAQSQPGVLGPSPATASRTPSPPRLGQVPSASGTTHAGDHHPHTVPREESTFSFSPTTCIVQVVGRIGKGGASEDKKHRRSSEQQQPKSRSSTPSPTRRMLDFFSMK